MEIQAKDYRKILLEILIVVFLDFKYICLNLAWIYIQYQKEIDSS